MSEAALLASGHVDSPVVLNDYIYPSILVPMICGGTQNHKTAVVDPVLNFLSPMEAKATNGDAWNNTYIASILAESFQALDRLVRLSTKTVQPSNLYSLIVPILVNNITTILGTLASKIKNPEAYITTKITGAKTFSDPKTCEQLELIRENAITLAAAPIE